MRLNLSIVGTLFRTELRMVLRDRRMIVASIVLPLLVTPLMFLGSSWSIKKREKTLRQMTYRYAVSGPMADTARDWVSAARQRWKPGISTNRFNFEEVKCEDPQAALAAGRVQVVLQGLPGANLDRTNTPNRTGMPGGKHGSKPETDEEESPVGGAPVFKLLYRGDRDDSARGMSRLREALTETRSHVRRELLKERGFDLKPESLAAVAQVDLASRSQVAGLAIGRVMTLLLLLFIFTSGAVVATDSLAGEKERGTLETLLTTAASRVEILAGKHLVILAVGLCITLIQALNLLVYIGFKLLPVPGSLAAAVTPGMVLVLFVLFLPVAALAASVLLLVSGYARSYKEAQMYFLPTFFLGLLPALAPMLPGLPLRSAVVLVPVANIALAAKQILIGDYDWPMILLSWLVTAGAVVWATRLGVRFLSAEQLITKADVEASEFLGGPALFEKRVLRWFAVLWAVLLIVSNYTQGLDLRLQVVINLIGLFFGASCLMLWRYRLHARTALALRAPRPAVWVGVLFAVPGGFLAALGLFRLANLIVPVSSKVTESFNENLLSDRVPFLQLLFCLTVLPGVFEEIAFRGLLLHGLRRRLRPLWLAVVVGLAFGIFHVALFRFVPTAFLGMLFAGVTMLTGSIFPAMLWHALNNGMGLLAFKLQVPENQLDPVCYLAGAGMLAGAFYIFWRNRTPYPGLRTSRKESRAQIPLPLRPAAADPGS